MKNELQNFENKIESKIHNIRGFQVILDEDLARLYQVETKHLNKAVKRNIDRFPEGFMFQLTKKEQDTLRFQNATSKMDQGGRRYLPYAFTEQGVAMLSGVLNSKIAIKVSIQIMNTFVSLRKLNLYNYEIDQRVSRVEATLIRHDHEFEKVFDAIESKDIKPEQGIFYEGQIFDSYTFASSLIKTAKKSITLFDNYIDETVLTLLSKKGKEVSIVIYTKEVTKQTALDLKKYETQYGSIKIKQTDKFHDRFLIIDDQIYHLGASLKDLGKKCFAFSKFDKETTNLLAQLEK